MNDKIQESVDSILHQWKLNHPSLRLINDSVQIKHADPDVGIYTLYFRSKTSDGKSDLVKIKAFDNKFGQGWKLNHLK